MQPEALFLAEHIRIFAFELNKSYNIYNVVLSSLKFAGYLSMERYQYFLAVTESEENFDQNSNNLINYLIQKITNTDECDERLTILTFFIAIIVDATFQVNLTHRCECQCGKDK